MCFVYVGMSQPDLGSRVFQLCSTHEKLQKLPENHFTILIVWMFLIINMQVLLCISRSQTRQALFQQV